VQVHAKALSFDPVSRRVDLKCRAVAARADPSEVSLQPHHSRDW